VIDRTKYIKLRPQTGALTAWLLITSGLITAATTSYASAPEAPADTQFTATVGATTAELSWAEFTGAENYNVSVSPSGPSCEVDSGSRLARCRGLVKSTLYSFSLTATNSSGTSDPVSLSVRTADSFSAPAPTRTATCDASGTVTVSPSSVVSLLTNQAFILEIACELLPADQVIYTTQFSGYTVEPLEESFLDSEFQYWPPATFTAYRYSTTGRYLVTNKSTTLGSTTLFWLNTRPTSVSHGDSTRKSRSISLSIPSGSLPAHPVPGSPQSATATAAESSATISWSAPSSGGMVETYTVESEPAGGSCSVSGETTSCEITGLENGVDYTFEVLASNYSGTSIAGIRSNQVTPTAYLAQPAPPFAPTALAGNQSAIVSWSAPQTGGETEKFIATATPGGQFCEALWPALSCTITGLANGTTYSISVVAENSSGMSEEAQVDSVTPSSPQLTRPPVSSPPVETPVISIGATGGPVLSTPGKVFTISGSGLNQVDQVMLGKRKADITLKTATKLGIRIPMSLPAGSFDLTLHGSFGSKTESSFLSVAKRKAYQKVSGFGGNSPVLHAQLQSLVKSSLRKLPGRVSLVCVGSTSGSGVTRFHEILASQRAKQACNFAKKQNPSLKTSIRIKPASGIGPQARGVRLILKNY
jgi:hypothetical protein